jgi:hypothetical protein
LDEWVELRELWAASNVERIVDLRPRILRGGSRRRRKEP